jgi:hypothetical protein
VVAVSEAAGDAAVEFDRAVDGFGAAVADAAGVEVGQERIAPVLQGRAEALIFGTGQVGGDIRSFSAIRRPSAGRDALQAARSCHAMQTSS